MNPELKVVIYEEKNILQELLNLLEIQYELLLSKDVMALDKIASQIESIGKKLANIELKRRSFVKDDNFKELIDICNDLHIKETYGNIKLMLKTVEVQKDMNSTLIKQQLFFTKKMMNLIKPSKNIGTYNSYGKVGK